ncbi:MAG: T9SS type A sorting domain-containing protein [Candidatus Eisenbacteria sp.]|nr:T9SS type A sorting domain-containing protein [Candidatus Eisenbacteria bacterium]
MRVIVAIFVLISCGFLFGMCAKAEQVVFDFENGPGPLFEIPNTADLWTIDCDGPNLRISKPEDPLTVNPNGFIAGGIRSRFWVNGDFSVTVDYELSTFQRDPSNGSTLNESILGVQDAVSQLFEVLRFAHGSSDQRIEAYGPDAPIGAQDPPPEVLWAGRYRVTRVGETMTGAFAPLGSEVFTSLGSAGGYGGPVQVICIGAQGVGRVDRERANTALDIAFDNLIIDGLISYPPTTHRVHADGSGGYPTIQDAINAAADGDTVLLANGIFTGDGNRDVDFLGKAIVVMSESGSPDDCIVDCGGSAVDPHRGFWFHSGEGPGSVLSGVTVRNGYADNGAGFLCEEGSSPHLSSCRIRANTATNIGGGAYCHHCSPTFLECDFRDNAAAGGGGIYAYATVDLRLEECRVTGSAVPGEGGGLCLQSEFTTHLTDCVIIENTSYEGGGGVYCREGDLVVTGGEISGNASGIHGGGILLELSSAVIDSCVMSDNATSQVGGGIFLSAGTELTITNSTLIENWATASGGAIGGVECTLTIDGCTMALNGANQGGAVYLYSDYAMPTPFIQNTVIALSIDGGAVRNTLFATPQFACCDIYGNDGGDWVSFIAGQLGTNGNFSADPCFCDAENGDYHLWNYSPCNQQGCGLIGAWPVGCEDPQVLGPEPQTRALWASVSPNPVSGTAHIRYVLPTPAAATLTIYDPAGRVVRRMMSRGQASGTLSWDATDALGHRVAAGAYFLRLSIGEEEVVRRVTIVR